MEKLLQLFDGFNIKKAKYDPTVINGGIINFNNSNAKLGSSDWMVVEADESDGSLYIVFLLVLM